jgi:threonine dehydratase
VDQVRHEDIRAAARLLNGVIWPTPCAPARRLSALLGAEIALKLENLQVTGSFKARGAFVKIDSLSAEQRRRGVIAMSAGNHAQGVAYHCQRLGIPATIVMPKATPYTKIERTAALGAQIVLHGAGLSDAAAFAHRRAEEERFAFIHPYDDPLIIAGQGTVGMEMLYERPDLDTLVVPVGGGGLIAGIAIAARAMKAGLRVIGVQSAAYPEMLRKLGRAPQAEDPSGRRAPTLAEGIAVKKPGLLTRRIVAKLVDELMIVEEDHIEHAVDLLIAEEKLVAEGAGAVGIAAILARPDLFRGRRLGLVVSGGNIDQRPLASILMRGLSREGRIARLRVEVNDVPGALSRVTGIVAACAGNILEIVHQRLFHDVPVTRAGIDLVVETRGLAHLNEIEARLRAEDFDVNRLSNTAEAPY